MEKFIAITGRLPKLSIAELESVFGAENIEIFSAEAVIINSEVTPEQYARLGGSIKLAKILTALPSDWKSIEKVLAKNMLEHSQYVDGKITIGMSLYGFKIPVQRLQQSLLSLKKQLKASSKSVRVILNKDLALSTAEVYHNKLTGGNAWELLVIGNGKKFYLAQTKYVQDIDSYVNRDRGRPMRDARVGMLPPKLAQTIINLATAEKTFAKNEVIDSWDETYQKPFDVLDPFCGTGVILTEALLMGYSVLGSDIDMGMALEYSPQNIQWTIEKFDIKQPIWETYLGSATKLEWKEFKSVACETYLGPPLTRQIPDAELNKMIYSVNKLHEQFLRNIGGQIKSNTRLCLAVPAWRRGVKGYIKLPVLENLGSLGYNWVEFEHVDGKNLIYDREGQFVARQLVTITKK